MDFIDFEREAGQIHGSPSRLGSSLILGYGGSLFSVTLSAMTGNTHFCIIRCDTETQCCQCVISFSVCVLRTVAGSCLWLG